jgi:hypothetical protein
MKFKTPITLALIAMFLIIGGFEMQKHGLIMGIADLSLKCLIGIALLIPIQWLINRKSVDKDSD